MELHADVQGMVAGAEEATDWKHYIRRYPWAALSVAFVGGFLIVPRRRRSVTKTAQKAAEAAVAKVRESTELPITTTAEAEKKSNKRGLIGVAMGFLGPIIFRAAQGYAAQYVENFIAQQGGLAAMGFPPMGPEPVPPGAASNPSRPKPSPSPGSNPQRHF